MKKIPVHIPHSSIEIPPEYKPSFLISPIDVKRELLQMTDWYTDKLADWSDRLVFPVSRLICDAERFHDKNIESMTQKGMWIFYTHASDGKPLKCINTAHENEILNRYYDPHHKCLTNPAEERIITFGGCLIVDVHSFPPAPFPHEPNQDGNRPDICIGTDSYHTPDNLRSFTERFFHDWEYTTTTNHPYSGTITPLSMYKQEPRLLSFMIELNRSLYMDTETGMRNAGYSCT